MNFDYDVVIIGGAFSGAATALMLKRKRPEARVLIIEKTPAFDRKVGESTTEVSSCYMTRILGLTHYLGHHQLAKQGLRLWQSRLRRPFQQKHGRARPLLSVLQADQCSVPVQKNLAKKHPGHCAKGEIGPER